MPHRGHVRGYAARQRGPVAFAQVVQQHGRKQIRQGRLRLGIGLEEPAHIADFRIAEAGDQQPDLIGHAPARFHGSGDPFMKPPWQRTSAGARVQRQVHDLVLHDRLERIVRIAGRARREDQNLPRAEGLGDDPARRVARPRVAFVHEGDVNVGGDFETGPRQAVAEPLLIDAADTCRGR